MKRHVTCFVEKAGFEPRTLGTKVERYDHCATRPVRCVLTSQILNRAGGSRPERIFNVEVRYKLLDLNAPRGLLSTSFGGLRAVKETTF